MTLGNLLKKIVQNLDAKVNKSGDTMTGNLYFGTTSSNDVSAEFKRTGGYHMKFGFLNNNGQFFLLDNKNSKSIISVSANGNATFGGKSSNGIQTPIKIESSSSASITVGGNTGLILLQRLTDTAGRHAIISYCTNGSTVYWNWIGETSVTGFTVTKSGLTITINNTGSSSAWYTLVPNTY